MKVSLVIAACLVTITANSQLPNYPTWKGRWTESQSERGACEWVFNGKNAFAKIEYWSTVTLDGRIHQGTFHIDTANKTVSLKFDKVIFLKNDAIVKSDYREEWRIISMNDNELLLSRRAVFPTDHPNKSGDKENVYVQLVRTFKEKYSQPTASNK